MEIPAKFDHKKMPDGDEISLLDLFLVLAENIKLLIVGPLAVGALAYAISYALPQMYTSVAYLRLPKTSEVSQDAETLPLVARSADAARALIFSPVILDKVIEKVQFGDGTLENRRRELANNIRWESSDSGPVVLSVSDNQPARAKAINDAVIDGWIDQTKPGPDQAERLKQKIELNDLQLNSVTTLIDRLTKETPQLVIPGMQNELATSLAKLQADRNKLVAETDDAQRKLRGVSRDVILSSPTLPGGPSFPKKGKIAVYSALASGMILLGLVVLVAAFRFAAADPNNAAKITRIRNALLLRKKSHP